MATCIVCNGTGKLLRDVCPLCEGDPFFLTDPPDQTDRVMAWEVNLGSWVRYDVETEELILEAQATGCNTIEYCARGQQYVVDLTRMQQVNIRTRVSREIRCVEVCVEVPKEKPKPEVKQLRPSRHTNLAEKLLSPAVHVPLPLEAAEEPLRLSEDEVRKVFTTHVPGVERLLYRDMPGQLSLNFITMAYVNGLAAFRGTDIHTHLLSLLRFIVHQFHDSKTSDSRHLRDIADAFTDCQAVQARVVERVGLELRGIRADFYGLVTRLVGDYKGVAIKMLACERISQRKAVDDGNPTHYENRLTSDIGELIGVNKDDVRRALLDEHAAARFPRLTAKDRREAAARCREIFDIDAVLQAFAAEVSAFDGESPPESLPRLFLDWASAHMTPKHIVFDEDTCTRIDVSTPLVLSIVEVLFSGKLQAEPEEMYRGSLLRDIFAAGT